MWQVMAEWIMVHPWMTFFLAALLIFLADRAISNICRAFYRQRVFYRLDDPDPKADVTAEFDTASKTNGRGENLKTYRDVIAEECPDRLTASEGGGVSGCPSDYFENATLLCWCGGGDQSCDACWNRPYNGEERFYKTKGERK